MVKMRMRIMMMKKIRKLMRILMILTRMFCPLHMPAEEHVCDFDYQVKSIPISSGLDDNAIFR